ncbi:MAG: M20/M25/M40 family metallo-hydrolase [Bacteroidota bacterium]
MKTPAFILLLNNFKISISICVILIFSTTETVMAQPSQAKMNTWAEQQLPYAIEEFREFLSLPNNASYPDHVSQNVAWCVQSFKKRGFTVQKIETTQRPLLLAEKKSKKGSKTVLVYLQVDGQPVDSSKWLQESPYSPTLKTKEGDSWKAISWDEMQKGMDDNWRVFARSASDAKGPIIMFLSALDILNDQKLSSNYNLKVIMDFEEELGSPNLPAAVRTNKDLLKSDMLIIFDGPMHVSNKPTLTFGARGISTIRLEVFGPRVAQHSGHYGNYAPNPAFTLTQLLASMKDDTGHVTLPGFYDGVSLDDETLKILSQVPDDEEAIKKKIGIAEIDNVSDTYQKSIQYPSLNIRGLQSGWVDEEVRTIIPASAIAEIDIRLVPESDAMRLIELVRSHIEQEGFHIVEGAPTEQERSTYRKLISFDFENSYDAFRTGYDTEVGQWLNRALTRAYGEEPIRIRIAGGSIPIAPFVTTLGIPAVSVPTVNPDNNQHSPNENLRIGNLKDGIRTYLSILTEKL